MSLDLFRHTQRQLGILRSAWEETPQSRGGIVALRGFHYQLTTTLAQLIRNWSAKSEVERTRQWTGLLAEALSDWTVLNGDGVIACQVKLTQSPAAVRSALTEFWLIDQLASRVVPDLHPQLKFRIISREAKLRSVAAAIERWAPIDGANKEDLSSFRRKVSARVELDPETEILAVLVNRFNAVEPVERLGAWLGQLMRASSSALGFDEALRWIWIDLQSLQRHDWSHQSLGYVWTDKDRPPEAIVKGPVLVGQRPTINHLRSGYFADREQIYDQLVTEVEGWLSSSGERSIPKVRMFWIGGRSGTGKTVALLHVLSRLYERGNGTVIWLEDKLALLPEVVRWCRPLLREGRTVIIGIDDPYNPLNQGDTNSALSELDTELMALRQQAVQSSLPQIVCCGPIEQRTRLKKEFSSIVDVDFADLPLETPLELQSIWTWFCKRTGKHASIPYNANADVLLVQLFFEWRTGEPIAEFAERFRRRIRAMDLGTNPALEDFLSRMLALNRLYTGYPAGALKELRRQPAFDAAFRRLENEEHHLTIEEFGTRSGLRLAHPHLANALYEAWFDPVEDEPYRRGHLRAGIQDALDSSAEPRDQLAPLWAVARSNTRARGGDWGQRVSSETLHSLLPELYYDLQRRFDNDLPAWMIPVWIEIQSQFPDLLLEPSPINQALLLLEGKRSSDKGFRLLCHKLLQHLRVLSLEHQERIADSIHAFLVQSRGWSGWAAVAIDYLLRTRKHNLGSAIRSWISSHRMHPDAPNLLEVALRTGADENVLLATCVWLDWSQVDNPSWSYLWQDLLRAFPQDHRVLKRGRGWLERVDPGNSSWGHVWQDLNRALPRHEELLQRGLSWLNDTESEEGAWAFVWQDLRRALPHSRELIEAALAWLDRADLNNRSWTFVWEDLWNAMPDDADLIERGRRWLEQCDRQQPSWTFMWQHLWSVQPGAEYLIEMGVEWLDRQPSDAAWNFVWTDLSDFLPEILVQKVCLRLAQKDSTNLDWPRLWLNAHRLRLPNKQLNDLGRKWLTATASDAPHWAEVWKALIRLAPNDDQLLLLGKSWLESVEPSRPGWGAVWSALWKIPEYCDELIEPAELWLKDAFPSGESWGLVWDAIRRVSPDADDMLTLGRDWLNQNEPSTKYWELVWLALYRRDVSDQDLMQLGLEWLEGTAFRNPNWGALWIMLKRGHTNEADLLDLARSWLENANPRSAWFGFVWGAIAATSPEDPRTKAIGRQWLDEADPKKGHWGANWEVFQREYADDDDLRHRGLNWIELEDPSARFWGYAWGALRRTWPQATEFVDMGVEWLLRAEVRNPSWSHVWLILQSIHPTEPRLRDAARRFLAVAEPDNPGWETVFPPLSKMLPKREVHERADALLQSNVSNRVWPLLWLARHGYGFAKEEHLESARQWLIETPFNGSGWRYVWEIVYRAYGHDQQLFELGKTCLTAPYVRRNEGWRKLWGTLFKAHPYDGDLFKTGIKWLEEADQTTNTWRETLQVLIRNRPEDEDLFDLGLDRLTSANYFLDGWNQLCQAMNNARRRDPRLLALLQTQLKKSNCSEKGWGQIWHSAFKADPSNAELFRLGEACAREKTRLSDSTSLILVSLCKADPQNEGLLDFASELLKDNSKRGGWFSLWSILFEIRPADANLLTSGLRQLRTFPQSSAWANLWSQLYRKYPDVEELQSLARGWLEERFTGDSWDVVWYALYTSTVDINLIRLAKQWLKESPGATNGWVKVWQTVHQQHGADPEITKMGKEWLEIAPRSSSEWPRIWGSLFENEPNDVLFEDGLQWLGELPPSRPQWIEVWKACWEARKGDQFLVKSGLEVLDDLSFVGWTDIWLALILTTEEREDLIEKALTWLHSALYVNRPLRASVCLELRRLLPNDEAILFIGV